MGSGNTPENVAKMHRGRNLWAPASRVNPFVGSSEPVSISSPNEALLEPRVRYFSRRESPLGTRSRENACNSSVFLLISHRRANDDWVQAGLRSVPDCGASRTQKVARPVNPIGLKFCEHAELTGRVEAVTGGSLTVSRAGRLSRTRSAHWEGS